MSVMNSNKSSVDWAPLSCDPHVDTCNVEVRLLLANDRAQTVAFRFSQYGVVKFLDVDAEYHFVCLNGGGHVTIGGVTMVMEKHAVIIVPRSVSCHMWTEEESMTLLLLT